MAKNLMPEIIKMLGVEYGEVFKLREVDAETCESFKFEFSEAYGLLNTRNGKSDLASDYFFALLKGRFEIVKLPWEPKKRDVYFYPAVNLKRVNDTQWRDDSWDFSLKVLGMVYRTKEEAEAHFAEDYEKLTGKKLEE